MRAGVSRWVVQRMKDVTISERTKVGEKMERPKEDFSAEQSG